ncbi:MAG: phosphoesterase, partial [Acidobacteriota bacterium]
QRGAPPSGQTTFTGQPRFISNMRDLGEFVHVDFPIQAGLYAAFILLGFGDDALDPNNPYLRTTSTTQQGFASFGPADITHLVTHGPRLALTGAWYQKWLAHRRLRPEAFAGRINVQLRGLRSYDINSEILNSEALAQILQSPNIGSANDVALLPMGFPEGSPAHPAYPGGHSAFIAAAVTILKGLFNEDFVIPNPVVANANGSALVPWTGAPLTVGNELNKLVGNVTHGRDGAGMHWRSDGRGNFIGEAQAVGVLLDYSRTYNEDFDGFELTLFSGQKINIKDGQVTLI